MQKIPSLFVRDFDNSACPATNQVEKGCEWVLEGEGVATIKWDGSACLVLANKLYRRHRHASGKGEPPPGWFHWSAMEGGPRRPNRSIPDAVPSSGHGWIPVYSAPADVHHREAWRDCEGSFAEGTFELVGPAIQRNPYGLRKHILIPHGKQVIEELTPGIKRSFEQLRDFLAILPHEGIVFYRAPSGGGDVDMVKLKRKDFGHPWPKSAEGPVAAPGRIPGRVFGTV